MNVIDAEKAREEGRVVRVWRDYDGEYLCRLAVVPRAHGDAKWKGEAIVVGVHRALNGPKGWRLPLKDGSRIQVYASQVRKFGGAIASWQASAEAAMQAEIHGLMRLERQDSKLCRQALEVLEQLQKQGVGRELEVAA